MPNVPYPYEVNGKLVTGNGSLIPISFLSKRSLLPCLTVPFLVSKMMMKKESRNIYFEILLASSELLPPSAKKSAQCKKVCPVQKKSAQKGLIGLAD